MSYAVWAKNLNSTRKHNFPHSFFFKLLQHGFRRGRSCETQLIEFIDDLTSDLEEGQKTDILITDFAKAFDKVHHSLLIHTLWHQGRGILDQELAVGQKTSSCNRGRTVRAHQRGLWCPPRLCPWPRVIPVLHQRPSLKALVKGTPICRWHYCLPCYDPARGHSDLTGRP